MLINGTVFEHEFQNVQHESERRGACLLLAPP